MNTIFPLPGNPSVSQRQTEIVCLPPGANAGLNGIVLLGQNIKSDGASSIKSKSDAEKGILERFVTLKVIKYLLLLGMHVISKLSISRQS
jgi:hypothetical protein